MNLNVIIYINNTLNYLSLKSK